VTAKPAAAPRRQIIAHAIDEHAEALGPLGLGPREVTKVVIERPGVGDLTSPAARAALARVGLTPETLVFTPERGAPSVVLFPPEPT
jgi:hypothetical protein